MPKHSKAKRPRLLNAIKMNKVIKITSGCQGTDDETLIKEEWRSCQFDVSKLVQKNGSIDSIGAIKTEETNDDDDTKDVKEIKIEPCEVIVEEFKPEENYAEGNDVDENKHNVSLTNTPDELVIEKLLCRCCHADGNFLSLQATDPLENVTYEHMLETCYNIQLFGTEVAGALRALCGLCAARLRDAHAFSQQVRTCEQRFHTLHSNNCIRVTTSLEIEVKEEPAESNDDEDIVTPKESLGASGGQRRKCLTKKRRQRVAPKQQNDTSTDTKPRRKKLPLKRNRSPTVLSQYSVRVGDNYKCTRCDKIFHKIATFYEHTRRVHRKLPIPCQLCQKSLNTKAQRREHKLKEHNIDERYRCNACDKVYFSKHGLKLHIKSYHMLGEIVKCAMCDYESHNTLSLRKHMVKHKTSKDFHCKYCKKSFLRKTNLTLHERIHTGDKRQVCVECGQAFVQKASLNYHMTKYHPEVAL